jgi:hypothetical protein
MSAAVPKPTNTDLHKCECSVISPAFLGVAVSLRARTVAELGSFNYGEVHNSS